jgi:Co/Zn/Cd efflux system component
LLLHPASFELDPHRGSSTYRRVLWTVLAINGAMFLIEIGAGVATGSASLPTLLISSATPQTARSV